MTEYVTIASTDELKPGERLVVELGRRWIAVFNVDGVYHAIDDTCTHAEVSLAEGELSGFTIECPQHGACFDIRNGRVLSAPANVPVRTYEVRIDGENVQLAHP